MKLYRFYQVSGFIEMEAESLEAAKALTHKPFILNTPVLAEYGKDTGKKAFVYVSAIGPAVEINPLTGEEIK